MISPSAYCASLKKGLANVSQPPSTTVIDVNLLGCLYITRIASVYLRHDRLPNTDRSIALGCLLHSWLKRVSQRSHISSLETWHNRTDAFPAAISPLRYVHNIRINTICPYMTVTSMVGVLRELWVEAKLPINTPMDVAKATAAVCVDSELHGKSVCVEGGRAWEVETDIEKLEP